MSNLPVCISAMRTAPLHHDFFDDLPLHTAGLIVSSRQTLSMGFSWCPMQSGVTLDAFGASGHSKTHSCCGDPGPLNFCGDGYGTATHGKMQRHSCRLKKIICWA